MAVAANILKFEQVASRKYVLLACPCIMGRVNVLCSLSGACAGPILCIPVGACDARRDGEMVLWHVRARMNQVTGVKYPLQTCP